MKNSLKIFAILILAAVLISFIGSVTITGKVTDESGQPLYGVSVTGKGTAETAVTDMNGIFRISVSQQVKTLVFSLNGYSTVEEKIGDRRVINVVLTMNFVPVQEEAKREMVMDAVAMPSSAAGAAYKSVRSFNVYNNNFNTEGYASVNENGYKLVTNNPLSTFSIDVDNASYSNIRRFINGGQLPPADAVRIEEMINYFKYEYPDPEGEHPFSVYTEIAACPWNNKHLLFQAGLKGKSIDKSKLPLLKSAFGLLVKELRPQDHVAIVVYAGAAGLVLESTPGNRKEAIMAAIDNLEAGGSTAGGAGLKLAYREAEKNFVKGGNNRIILATDGDFNVGESSNGGMERLVEEKREAGVFITVLGFGMGNYKDDKMEIIADKGNGNYAYIDNLQEARRVLVREFGGTLFTIAKDVKFQIEFNPEKVSSYRLIGYENRLLNDEDFNDDTKDAGEMGSGHNVTALYEIVPAGADEAIPSVDPLKYGKRESVSERNGDDGKDYYDEYLTVKLRYKKPDGKTSMMFEKPVKKLVTEISENMKFAAAVTEFGMLLRDSEYKGNSTYESAAKLARSSRGSDEDGYRSEMIRLIDTARDLSITADKEQ